MFDNEMLGMRLWSMMLRRDDPRYSGGYPISSDARQEFLSCFKPKAILEKEWISKESGAILEILKDVPPILPLDILPLIAEYAVKW